MNEHTLNIDFCRVVVINFYSSMDPLGNQNPSEKQLILRFVLA